MRIFHRPLNLSLLVPKGISTLLTVKYELQNVWSLMCCTELHPVQVCNVESLIACVVCMYAFSFAGRQTAAGLFSA